MAVVSIKPDLCGRQDSGRNRNRMFPKSFTDLALKGIGKRSCSDLKMHETQIFLVHRGTTECVTRDGRVLL